MLSTGDNAGDHRLRRDTDLSLTSRQKSVEWQSPLDVGRVLQGIQLRRFYIDPFSWTTFKGFGLEVEAVIEASVAAELVIAAELPVDGPVAGLSAPGPLVVSPDVHGGGAAVERLATRSGSWPGLGVWAAMWWAVRACWSRFAMMTRARWAASRLLPRRATGAGEFGDQPRLGGQQRPQRCTVIGRVQCERGASAIPALTRGEHHGHAVARPQCDVVVGREHVARHELAVEPLGDCGDNDLLLQQREVSADA